MSVETEPTVPGHWLESLTQHQPAPWRWGRSVRSTLGIGLPMLIGLLSNDLLAGMWVALGALMHTTSERDGTYDSSFRHLAIATPVAMLGCLAGYLGLLPWPVTVAVMAVLAFLAGILSSFGAALSVGCLQALLLAGIAIGIPASASPLQPALLYLVGTLLYAALLGLEASFFHQRPGRNMLAGLFNAMASLAINRAERRPVDEPLRLVRERFSAAHAALLQQRRRLAGRSLELERSNAILQRSDAILAILLARDDLETLRSAAQRLHQISGALGSSTRFPAAALGTPDSDLDRHLRALTALLDAQAIFDLPLQAATAPALPPSASRLSVNPCDRLAPSRDVMLAALVLALCTGLAYATRWVANDAHWFWIPVTVSLLLRPDYASIMARSVLRSLGALAGVALGTAILLFLPQGGAIVLVIAVLASLLPWGMQHIYALQVIPLAAILLLLGDIVMPGDHSAAFALQCLLGTVAGAIIVIAVGALVWSRHKQAAISARFIMGRHALAEYLQASLPDPATACSPARNGSIRQQRRNAYRELSGLRAQLQRQQYDPPPTGHQAAAWYPLLDGAERLCDDITIYSLQAAQAPDDSTSQVLLQQAGQLAGKDGGTAIALSWPGTRPSTPEARLIERMDNELSYLRTLSAGR